MRLNILLLLLPSAFAAAPLITDSAFQNQVLSTTNKDRALNQAPPLVWNAQLAQFAQNWANNCTWAHSGGPYGENLFGMWSSATTTNYTSQTPYAINAWYQEISSYDFTKPGFYEATGHFTQLVWKSTTAVGCAWNTVPCMNNGYNFFKFVCEYNPPGNIIGGNYFQLNVLPVSGAASPSPTVIIASSATSIVPPSSSKTCAC
jgi:hypothetical protein